jgi:hypothetical protein
MTHYAIAIISLTSLAILWAFLFWLYKDFCVDSFRQKVFALRDELFDAACHKQIPFDHKAYGRLRVTMNGAIRFAHELSLAHFLFVVLRHHSSMNNTYGYNAKLSEEMKDLSDEKKEIFYSFQKKFSVLLLKHIFVSSPLFLLTLILPFISYVCFRDLAAWLLKKFSVPLEEMQSVAYAAGDD